jgi:hypothetical protein
VTYRQALKKKETYVEIGNVAEGGELRLGFYDVLKMSAKVVDYIMETIIKAEFIEFEKGKIYRTSTSVNGVRKILQRCERVYLLGFFSNGARGKGC